MYNVTADKTVGKIGDGIGDGGFEHGKYYYITVKMEKVLDLAKVTEPTEVPEGITMTGKLAAGGQIKLGAGEYTLAKVEDSTCKTDFVSGVSNPATIVVSVGWSCGMTSTGSCVNSGDSQAQKNRTAAARMK